MTLFWRSLANNFKIPTLCVQVNVSECDWIGLLQNCAYQNSVVLEVFGSFARMKQYTSDEEYLAAPPMVHIARRAFQDTAQLVPKGFLSVKSCCSGSLWLVRYSFILKDLNQKPMMFLVHVLPDGHPVFTADRSGVDDAARDPKELKKFALKMSGSVQSWVEFPKYWQFNDHWSNFSSHLRGRSIQPPPCSWAPGTDGRWHLRSLCSSSNREIFWGWTSCWLWRLGTSASWHWLQPRALFANSLSLFARNPLNINCPKTAIINFREFETFSKGMATGCCLRIF